MSQDRIHLLTYFRNYIEKQTSGVVIEGSYIIPVPRFDPMPQQHKRYQR